MNTNQITEGNNRQTTLKTKDMQKHQFTSIIVHSIETRLNCVHLFLSTVYHLKYLRHVLIYPDVD